MLNAVSQIANRLENNESFAIPLLAVRASKLAYENTTDQPLIIMAKVLSKMAENGKLAITRGELRDMYSKFAGTSITKLAECFEKELAIEEKVSQRKMAGEVAETFNMYEGADETLANALTGLWDESGKPCKNAECKMFSPTVAKQAVTLTKLHLTRIDSEPKAVNVFGGNESMIICDASYETNRGESHVLVPVEITSKGALIPTVFATEYGFADLTKETLQKHVLETAGKSFHVNAQLMADTLSITKEASTLDEFELQVLATQRLVSSKKLSKTACDHSQTVPLMGQGAFLQELAPQESALVTPKGDDFEKFETKLSTAKGLAELTFGKKAVDDGRNVIASKVTSFGYCPQVKVASCDDDSITYAVAVDSASGKFGFEVMAEINNGKVTVPSIIAVDDRAYDFSNQGLNTAMNSRANSVRAVAMVSPLYDLKVSEVMEKIREAADCGNYRVAEEALNVLSQKNDPEAYIKASAEYMRSFGADKIEKQASKKCGCSRVIKVSTHSQPICGHLNLPLDKVYQNEHGECIPKCRQNIETKQEGFLFNTTKAFI